jgi:protein-disulfide isomerase
MLRPRSLVAIAAAAIAVALSAPAPSKADSDGTAGRVVRVIHNPPGEAPILGPRYAAVTIELFFMLEDYRAGNAHAALVQLARRHPLRMRLVYRPLIRPTDRLGANTLAMEAHRQGRFHELVAAFYKDGRPRRSELEKVAEEAGVNWDRYVEARQRHTHDEALRANDARASRFKLNSATASLLVNGEPINQAPTDIEQLEMLYDTAYARAREILDHGYPISELYGRLLRQRVVDAQVPRIPVGQVDGPVRRRPKKNALPVTGRVDYSGPHTIGPADAPVVIVSFCRFASRNCLEQFREVGKTMAAFEGQVRHVLKPLYDPIDDPHERRIHLAAECAADQGAFWEYLSVAYNYNTQLRSDESKIHRAFAALDLDDEAFLECLDSERHAERVDAQVAEAQSSGIEHTPSTIIGGRIYIGRPSSANLMRLVELELAPGMLGSWLETSSAHDRRKRVR